MYQNVFPEKSPVRVVGVEDGGFPSDLPGRRFGYALLIAVLMDFVWIERLLINKITIDGLDATDKLIEMLHQLKFDTVMLGGISFAGFNLVDPIRICKEFSTPVIVVSRKKPDNIAVKNALFHHFRDWKIRWEIIEQLGEIYEVFSMPGEAPVYLEVAGADFSWAKKLVCKLAVCCRIPEPVRVARLVAHGLTKRD